MDNSRKAFVNKTAMHFRSQTDRGLGVQQLHDRLASLQFDDHKYLSKNDIAAIVNYCYYPGNTDVLRNIMKGSI